MTSAISPVQGSDSAGNAVGIAASCAGVAALSGSARSYLPGRTVPGVSVDTDRVDVYVVARYVSPLTDIADQLAAALETVLAGRTFTSKT